MRRNRTKLRLAKKKSPKNPEIKHAFYWLFFFALTLWFTWVIYNGSPGGILSSKVSGFFDYFLGQAQYFFPLFFIYGLVSIFAKIKKPHKGLATMLASVFLILSSISCFFELARTRFTDVFDGGWLGRAWAEALGKIFGDAGIAIFALAMLAAGIHIMFKISWLAVARKIARVLKNDYRSWLNARREIKIKLSQETGEYAGIAPAAETPPPWPVTGSAQIPPEIPPKEKAAAPERRAGEGKRKEPLPKKPQRAANAPFAGFRLPATDLLEKPGETSTGPSGEELSFSKKKLEETFQSFNIAAYVSGIFPGPVITRYEVTPSPGVKINSVVSLSNDVALAMKAPGIRIIPHIPGKSAIGFEIPNPRRTNVAIREILESPEFNGARAPLTIVLGRHSEGSVALANLENMPHLLVSGATNSGKSIFLHSVIFSLVYRNTPGELKFMMIDPKRLELTFYEDTPYLYDPQSSPDSVSVITNPKDAAQNLKGLLRVMEARYMKFEMARVKNIAAYNEWAARNGEEPEFYIVVVIDELADLILQTKNVVEDAIQRLSQMARAVGIHLILATQRPSVDVITGVIKANLPSRVALQVTSRTDSRVIIDGPGAEALIGRGDLLYLASDAQKPARIQGACVPEKDILALAEYLKGQGRPQYPVLQTEKEKSFGGKGGSDREIITALELIFERKRVSQDLLKAHFGSSARATNLLSILEMNGFISKPEGSNRWEIYLDKIENYLSTAKRTNAKSSKGVS